MAVAETLSDLVIAGVFALGGILIIALIVVIVYYILKKKRGFKDEMKEMFKEMVIDAKLNKPDNLKELWRVPYPDSKLMTGVYMGEIIGYNRIDLLATIEDLLTPDSKYNEVVKDFKPEDIEQAKEIMSKTGKYLNFIVYKPKNSGLLKRKPEEGLICYDDQIRGLNDFEGKLAVIGEGTDRLGVYFSVLSGLPERIHPSLGYLVSRGWIRWAMRLESIHIESTEEAMRMDTDSAKLMMFSALSGKKEEKGG